MILTDKQTRQITKAKEMPTVSQWVSFWGWATDSERRNGVHTHGMNEDDNKLINKHLPNE